MRVCECVCGAEHPMRRSKAESLIYLFRSFAGLLGAQKKQTRTPKRLQWKEVEEGKNSDEKSPQRARELLNDKN